MKISLNGFGDIEWTWNDHCQISKGNNYKNVDKVMVLVLCTLSDDALYFYEVYENILNGFHMKLLLSNFKGE